MALKNAFLTGNTPGKGADGSKKTPAGPHPPPKGIAAPDFR
jgi:hypothetical protein